MARFQPGVCCVDDRDAAFWEMCTRNCAAKGHDSKTRFGVFLDSLQFIMHALDIPKSDLNALNCMLCDALDGLRGMGRLDVEFSRLAEYTC